MCRMLNASTFLALVLSRRDKITPAELQALSHRVMEKSPAFLVDTTGQSLEITFQFFPRVFTFDGDQISLDTSSIQSSEQRKYLDQRFLSALPDDTKSQLLELVA